MMVYHYYYYCYHHYYIYFHLYFHHCYYDHLLLYLMMISNHLVFYHNLICTLGLYNVVVLRDDVIYLDNVLHLVHQNDNHHHDDGDDDENETHHDDYLYYSNGPLVDSLIVVAVHEVLYHRMAVVVLLVVYHNLMVVPQMVGIYLNIYLQGVVVLNDVGLEIFLCILQMAVLVSCDVEHNHRVGEDVHYNVNGLYLYSNQAYDILRKIVAVHHMVHLCMELGPHLVLVEENYVFDYRKI